MFRYLVPRQHGSFTTTTSIFSQVYKGCNRGPLKYGAGAWNSCRFLKDQKGHSGKTTREISSSFSKMSNKNEEEYFYNKTKTDLEELKKRIKVEPLAPPEKRKLEREALNLDLQLKRMDLRAVIDRAEGDRLAKKLEQKESDPKKADKPQIQRKEELEDKLAKHKDPKKIDKPKIQRKDELDIKRSEGNKIHYAKDGQQPLQRPPKAHQPKTQQSELLRKPDPADELILKKRQLQQKSLQIVKTDLRDLKDKVDVVDKLQQPPKPTALQKLMNKHIDMSRLGRNKNAPRGQLRRDSPIQKSIEEAEKTFKDTKKKE